MEKQKPISELLNFSILNIDKPTGSISFLVSDFVRREFSVYGIKKIGYFGTLDTMVTGVLPIVLGRALQR